MLSNHNVNLAVFIHQLILESKMENKTPENDINARERKGTNCLDSMSFASPHSTRKRQKSKSLRLCILNATRALSLHFTQFNPLLHVVSIGKVRRKSCGNACPATCIQFYKHVSIYPLKVLLMSTMASYFRLNNEKCTTENDKIISGWYIDSLR